MEPSEIKEIDTALQAKLREACTMRIPCVIRHDKSGVWLCYILGRGITDPSTSLLVEGRRVWSWDGGRLECSQVAMQGARAEDKLGNWVMFELRDESKIETIFTSAEIVEACRDFPVWTPNT